MEENLSLPLADILKKRVSRSSWEWFSSTRNILTRAASKPAILRSYTSATRYLGRDPLNPSASEKLHLESHSGQLILQRWHCDDLGRAIFLLDVHENATDAYELALACYEHGDSSEQTSWLRGLNLLPEAERFLPTAIDSCRTNIIPMFEAIACENPYPSLYFPELNFNQMVLKSLFNGIALSRIAGLKLRLNEALSRMADDYVSEREAAGRQVPTDIWYVIAPAITTERLARVHRYLDHVNPEHRHWAAAGLKLRKDANL